MQGIIVGLGGRARSWIGVCQRNPDVTLVGYVDIVQKQRDRIAQQLELPQEQMFASMGEAVKAVGADFALDVTPPAAHESVVTEAFALGLHVLGEKPLSDNFDAAKRTVAAAESTGLTHMVTQNYRFGKLPRTTHRLLKEHRIGKPAQVTVGFYRAWATRPGTHYTTMPYPLLTDMGIHHFDMLRYVLGREPVRVYARTWNPSWGWHAGDAAHTAIIEFTDGLIGTHHSSGCSVGKQSPWNGEWRIEGPEGSLTWEDDVLYFTRAHPSDKRARQALPLDELAMTGQDALLAEFVAAINEGRTPECSGKDNLKSLALVFAAIQSAKEGRFVDIAELLS